MKEKQAHEINLFHHRGEILYVKFRGKSRRIFGQISMQVIETAV